jgi:DNA-binding transcriptional LysR family regulator
MLFLQLKLLSIKLPRWQVPYVIVTLKNRTLSPMAQVFIDHVREVAKPLAEGR